MKIVLLFLVFLCGCASGNKQTYLEVNLEWQSKNKALRISYDFPREVELVKLSGVSPRNLKYWQLQNSDLEFKVDGENIYIISQTKKKKSFESIVFLVETRRENIQELPFYLNQQEVLISTESILVQALDGDINDADEIYFPVKLNLNSPKPKNIYLNKQSYKLDFFENDKISSKTVLYWGRDSRNLEKEDLYLSKRFTHNQKKQLILLAQQLRQLISQEFTQVKKVQPTLYFLRDKANSYYLTDDSIVLGFDNNFSKSHVLDKYKLAIKALYEYYLKDLPSLNHSLVKQIYTDYFEFKEKVLLKETGQLSKGDWLLETEHLVNKCIFSEALGYKHYREYCEKLKVLMFSLNLNKSLMFFWEGLIVKNTDAENVLEELNDFYEEHVINEEIDFDEIFNTEFNKNGEKVISLMNEVGLKFEKFQSQRIETSKLLAESMMTQLYTKNCQEENNIKVFNRTIFTRGLRKCEGFVKNFYVYTVNGHHIFREAQLAYEATRLTCITKGVVTFKSLSGQSLTVNCFGLKGPLKLVHIDQGYTLK